ncbi:MAG: hypothetical protein WA947_00995 [Phormidesmis sp.]
MPSAESVAIQKRAAKMLATRQITQADRTFLMSVFAGSKIDDDSEALINQIYESLTTGKICAVE